MCREKGAVRHDDRIDCLAQGIKWFTDALAISAQETINTEKRDDWNDMMQAWIDDPEQAASHLAFGFDLKQRQQARLHRGQKSVHTWT